jgi:hypothetical protein
METTRRSRPGILGVTLWLVASGFPAPAPGQEASRVKARSHTLVGELVRVDLARRTVVVKTTEREPREHEIVLDDATRITSGGRVQRIEDLRGGERVLATCVDDQSGRHRARVLKVGPSRHAAPAPSATPAPSPPGP